MKRSTRCLTRVAMLAGLALSIGGSVQAEQADAAEASKTTVYVLRPSSFEPTTRIWTFADERFLGTTRGGSYTMAQLAEGKHLIWNILPGQPDASPSSFPRMIATEGVVSTLFYRWMTDPAILDVYRDVFVPQ